MDKEKQKNLKKYKKIFKKHLKIKSLIYYTNSLHMDPLREQYIKELKNGLECILYYIKYNNDTLENLSKDVYKKNEKKIRTFIKDLLKDNFYWDNLTFKDSYYRNKYSSGFDPLLEFIILFLKETHKNQKLFIVNENFFLNLKKEICKIYDKNT